MKKVIKYIGIGLTIFVIGGLGGLMIDYVIFSKVIEHPMWSKHPIIQALDNRVTVIKNTEKIIVENHDSLADIAARAATSVTYVEVVSIDNTKKSGNGVIIGSDGVIATTLNVINETDRVYVKLFDDTFYTAKSIYADTYMGITFLKIDAENLATVSFANSDDAQSGKRLIGISQSRIDNGSYFASGGFIGNAYDFSIASPTSDYLQGTLKVDFSESVFHMSVGAPAVDYHGDMIGLIAQRDMLTLAGEKKTEYYAIAANDVYKSFENFLRSQSEDNVKESPLLGVDYDIIGGIDVYIDDLSIDNGAKIDIPQTYQERIAFNNTFAAQSGLLGGDIVVIVDNIVVNAKNNLSRLLHNAEGNNVTLKVLRGENLLPIEIVVQ